MFKQLEDSFEKIKAEVQAKEEFSKEDIQELLVKSSMEYSHYTTFVHKFVISIEEYQKCNIALDVKMECFNEVKKMADKVNIIEKNLELSLRHIKG